MYMKWAAGRVGGRGERACFGMALIACEVLFTPLVFDTVSHSTLTWCISFNANDGIEIICTRLNDFALGNKASKFYDLFTPID